MNKTLFILDWDNTLVPSEIMSFDHDRNPTFRNNEIIMSIEKTILDIFSIIKNHGHILILTSSEDGWIDLFSKLYFSQDFHKYIKDKHNDIEIISARSRYQDISDNHKEWKKMAMYDYYYSGKHRDFNHVISMGDNHLDHYSISSVIKDNQKITLKSVKFLESPDISVFIKQLDYIKELIHTLANPGNAYIMTLIEENNEETDISIMFMPLHFSYDFIQLKKTCNNIDKNIDIFIEDLEDFQDVVF